MNRAISLLSGGMDSLVSLAIALKDYEVYPLHVNYRHRTEKKEFESFEKITRHYGLKKKLIADIDYLRKIGGSSLTDLSIKPESGAPVENVIPSSYVPFRNTHLLSIAVSYAEVIDAQVIFIGVVENDSSGYPDCRKDYIEQFNRLIMYGSKKNSKIKVNAPLIEMKKEEIIRKGIELNVPFEHTWSCYTENDLACGECQSCYLRLKAFEEAGISDPVKYR